MCSAQKCFIVWTDHPPHTLLCCSGKLDCEIDSSCVAIWLPWHLVIRPSDSPSSAYLFLLPPPAHQHCFQYKKAWNTECRLITASVLVTSSWGSKQAAYNLSACSVMSRSSGLKSWKTNKQTNKNKKKTRQARDDTLNRTAQHADPHHDRAIPLKALSHQSQLI